MQGTLYGVGTGCGDPEQLTYKAVRIINQCAVIAVPTAEKEKALSYRTIKSIIEHPEEKRFLCLPMPMTNDCEKLRQAHEAAARIIEAELKKGNDVAFAVIGDPTLFATYSYISVKLSEKGYNTKMINGVTSICAAGTAANRFLTLGSEELHVFPSECDIDSALKLNGTKVFMKSASKIQEFRRILRETECEAFLAENCGLENEKIYYGAENFPEEAGYLSIIIVREKYIQ